MSDEPESVTITLVELRRLIAKAQQPIHNGFSGALSEMILPDFWHVVEDIREYK